jgi:hypothetical protein
VDAALSDGGPAAGGDVPVSLAHQVRAPKEDGAVIAEPQLAEAGALARANATSLHNSSLTILGRAWQHFAQEARNAMRNAAVMYLDQTGGIRDSEVVGPVVMAGHQPDLFHPGVWVKNFALTGVAGRIGAMPFNLVVDNDAVKSTTIHFPAANSEPYRATEPFDSPAAGEPYEERTVHDEGLFATLPQRVNPGWPFRPLLGEFWAEAVRAGRRTALLGSRLASARRALERRWGCHNLEVPVSAICQTRPYASFAADLLLNLPRFHAAYNDSVDAYRRRHGLVSTSHPVPDLVAEGDWLETPFWAWRVGAPRRGRLMARLAPEGIELRVGDDPWPRLPREPAAMVRACLDLGKQGLRVRSRALTNTMYARLFLCDLFIHGIGGGQYDEVTDAIIRRYYGIEPPAYLVLSATLLLPLPHHAADPEQCRRLHREARDLYYNPQRHLDADTRSRPDLAGLLERKQGLVRTAPADRRGRRERFRELRELSERLRVPLLGKLETVRRAEADCEGELRANAILQRRDYPFVLYPERILRPFCEQFLAEDAVAGHR